MAIHSKHSSVVAELSQYTVTIIVALRVVNAIELETSRGQ